MDQNISRLVELAKTIKMTAEQKEEQRCSFVFGNVAMEDEERKVTREMVDARSKALSRG
jgi:hypothetical protein